MNRSPHDVHQGPGGWYFWLERPHEPLGPLDTYEEAVKVAEGFACSDDPPDPQANRCQECNCPTDRITAIFCCVCADMRITVMTRPWFERAHKEWVKRRHNDDDQTGTLL